MAKTPALSVLLAALLLSIGWDTAVAGSNDMLEKFVNVVKEAAPKGWSVQSVQSGQIPPDWYSADDKAGLLVNLANQKSSAKVWILPPDWIAIRNVQNQAPRTTYWEGVLGGRNYKVISEGGDYKFQQAFGDNMFHKGVSTTSLVNSGYPLSEQIFAKNRQVADRMAEQLVNEHCKTPAQLSEAAHSLIVLGVPAKSVILKAARETPDGFLCSALGYLGGTDSNELLAAIVANPRAGDDARKNAAMSLHEPADASVAAALLAGFKLTTNDEVKSTIAKALSHARYKPAGPALLEAFRAMKNDYFKLDLAQALAAVGYTEALPDLKAFEQRLFCENPVPPPGSIKMASISEMPGSVPLQGAQLALLRLSGNWGKPSRSMRIHVIPPAVPAMGKSMPLLIYVENMGTQPFQSWNGPGPGLIVDGKPLTSQAFIDIHEGLSYLVSPGAVHAIFYDLSQDGLLPGPHAVKYVMEGAESNLAPFVVRLIEPGPEELYAPDLERVNRIIASNPKDVKALAKRARIYAAMKKFSQSALDYMAALGLTGNLDPNRVLWFKELSVVHRQMGQKERASADLSAASECESEIKRQREWNDKLEWCNQAIRKDHSDESGAIAGKYMGRAHLYYKAGEFKKALADCDKALSVDPRCVNYPVARGQVYNALGEYSKAIADFTSVVHSMPEAYSNRGYSYLMLKQYDHAMSDCNKAFEEAKRCGMAVDYLLEMYDHRGQVYLESKQYEKAIADFNAALALKTVGFLDKDDVELLQAEIKYYRSVAFEKAGRHEQASEDKRAAQAVGYSPEKHLGIAFSWVGY
jgi:tetratricopeptide (TPR) repeat protein